MLSEVNQMQKSKIPYDLTSGIENSCRKEREEGWLQGA